MDVGFFIFHPVLSECVHVMWGVIVEDCVEGGFYIVVLSSMNEGASYPDYIVLLSCILSRIVAYFLRACLKECAWSSYLFAIVKCLRMCCYSLILITWFALLGIIFMPYKSFLVF